MKSQNPVSCWLTDPPRCASLTRFRFQFGADVVLGSQRQADDRTSALNHSILPREALFLKHRSYLARNCFPHSYLITVKKKLDSTGQQLGEKKREILCVDRLPLSFFKCFLWLVAKKKTKLIIHFHTTGQVEQAFTKPQNPEMHMYCMWVLEYWNTQWSYLDERTPPQAPGTFGVTAT